ncbi:MAG TPA: ABC transporter permease [Opitutaceae bacterium]|nr:ABC transporter permease [Opitutaceae bacterium]
MLLLRIARRFRSLFRRRSAETEMAEEMRFHLEQRAAEFEGDGLTAEEARYAAQRKFGNAASIEEQARDAWGWLWLENFLKDLRLGVRSLLKSPGFTLLAIITLALGIGANTAMFGMIQTILFKPLPYPDGDQLVRLYRVTAQSRNGHIAPADFLEFRRAIDDLGEVAAYTPANASLSEPGNPAEMAYAARVSANLFGVLGIPPQLGRAFHPEEEAVGRDRVVILSQRVWLRRYGGNPDIVDRNIRVDGEQHKVIGVMPDTFNEWRHLGMIDFFRPLALTQEQAAGRGDLLLRVMIRRSPARLFSEVEGFVTDFGARMAKDFPEANAESSWSAAPLPSTINGKSARPMFNMMIALSGLVLLIACSNLANLLLARTMARAREFAVRGALGASRTQLLRPLVAESLLLALLGGVGAVFFAVWFRDYMAIRSMGDSGEGVVMDIGWPVFGWAFVAALATAVAFGLAPALFALRLNLNDTLKSGGRGTVGGRGHRRFRHALIVGQFAVAMTLLAAAGVQIRGLNELNNRRTGWASDHLITGSILLPAATYPDAEKINAFHRLTLEHLAALPGVASASISSFTPFFNWPDTRKFVVDGRALPQPGKEPAAIVNTVSPGYFDVYGTRLLAGRAFDERDTAQAPKVFIVSEPTARALFGSANPIGRRLAQVEDGNPRWGEVVGVVTDVEPAVNTLNLVPHQVYQPMAQEPKGRNEIAVRTTGVAPLALLDSIRETMTTLDPDLPVRQLQHAELTVERANYQVAVGRDMFSGMAALGLGLASLGIYGVIARTMAQRTGEFAIRVALGASLGNITRLVLVSGVKLACFGSLLGLLGGIGICRLLTTANPAMRTNTTEVLVGATLLLVATALLACWLPARRAGKVNPVDALRAE